MVCFLNSPEKPAVQILTEILDSIADEHAGRIFLATRELLWGALYPQHNSYDCGIYAGIQRMSVIITLPGATVKCSYCLRSNQACSRTKEALIVRSLIRENESEFLGCIGDLFRDDLAVWPNSCALPRGKSTWYASQMG